MGNLLPTFRLSWTPVRTWPPGCAGRVRRPNRAMRAGFGVCVWVYIDRPFSPPSLRHAYHTDASPALAPALLACSSEHRSLRFPESRSWAGSSPLTACGTSRSPERGARSGVSRVGSPVRERGRRRGRRRHGAVRQDLRLHDADLRRRALQRTVKVAIDTDQTSLWVHSPRERPNSVPIPRRPTFRGHRQPDHDLPAVNQPAVGVLGFPSRAQRLARPLGGAIDNVRPARLLLRRRRGAEPCRSGAPARGACRSSPAR